MDVVFEQSVILPTRANSQSFNVGPAVTSSAPIQGKGFLFSCNVDFYIRAGNSCLADGSDLFLYAGNLYRVAEGWTVGGVLSVITNGASGVFRITPNA